MSATALTRRLRVNDTGRTVAAHMARVRYGYPAGAVSAALGCRSHG